MPPVDFDFRRYVEQRKGRRLAEAREGAAYAYPGDLRFLRTLEGARPVRMALDVAARLVQSDADSTKRSPVSERSHANLWRAMKTASDRLRVAPLQISLDEKLPVRVALLGDDSDARLVISPEAAAFDEGTFTHLAGAALGAMQNGHVSYGTARYQLHHFSGRFARWLLVPARAALDGWNRRAEVTRDRAGLLATRDLETSLSAIAKIAAEDELATRKDTLTLFAASNFYRAILGETGGGTIEACNATVAERLSK